MKSAHGFSLLEIIISIMVISILAAIALTSSQNLIHRQRYVDATQRVQLFVQQARNRAQTQLGLNESYGFAMNVGDHGAVSLFKEPANGNKQFLAPPDTLIDSFAINGKEFKVSAKKDSDIPCANTAGITFAEHAQKTLLWCDGVTVGVNLLKLTIESTNNSSYNQTYLIHSQSGLLQ